MDVCLVIFIIDWIYSDVVNVDKDQLILQRGWQNMLYQQTQDVDPMLI